jgi:hypothetical protein
LSAEGVRRFVPGVFERVVVGVDVQGFSARIGRRQLRIQAELDRILAEAAHAANLDRNVWDRTAEGDGEVAVLPGDVDLLLIVRRFVTELDQLLADHNEDHSQETRIRLRVAMNLGSVIPGGSLGYGGEALIGLARLLDSRNVRRALEDVPGANLAQIISESLFQRAVLPAVGGLRPGQFRKVVVNLPAKGFRQTAYLYVPGIWPDQRQARRPATETIFPNPGPWPRQKVSPEPPGKDAGPEAEPVILSETVQNLLGDLHDVLAARRYEEADGLTTQILLEAAQRGREGSLRSSDAERLPDALLTELNVAWADSSGDRWGFAAQRKRLAGLTASSHGLFHPLSLALGWRHSEDKMPPPYPEFVRTAGDPDLPFFPTLRRPEHEYGQDEAWRDAWKTTAVSVHLRLRSWE